ncbi:metallophosphoesterase [Granulicella sp. dw_53]|uniref:metallophosphoesterase n=1 Tax=Granulicella sp. dw_53 TaxID=2719792 RepID=UPI001BD35564|nr:metallophosphoesterase [Granulicella sp. dw_53]
MRLADLRRWAVLCGLALGITVVGTEDLQAQAGKKTEAKEAITALMVSDIHFDPLHDPGKAQRLFDAQEGEWNAILASAPSPDQTAAFAKLQKACGAKRSDSPYALLQSSLEAMKKSAPDAKFALMSGDLVVHNFDCRFKTIFPEKTAQDYATFVEKTERYVVGQLRLSLAGLPVYVTLGNNDSGCKDYAMDREDAFLKTTQAAMVDGLAGSAKEKTAAAASYSDLGDMSLMMKAPMQRTRLIVLNDIFQSKSHQGCDGKPQPAAADAQIAWLTKELAEARREKQRVWVMGHIPAGVDPYTTFSKFKDICGGEAPAMFLSSERLADVMGQYADVIRLGIFGHSHMDEIRLFGAEEAGAKGGKVAIKMVSSISPVDGNNPSFTVAKVSPEDARLLDFEVIAASNQTGVSTTWSKEYAYGETFHQPDFSAETLKSLLADFTADPDARTDMSRAYLTHYFVGDQTLLLKSLWPQYVCALDNHTAKGFAACVCPAASPGK